MLPQPSLPPTAHNISAQSLSSSITVSLLSDEYFLLVPNISSPIEADSDLVHHIFISNGCTCVPGSTRAYQCFKTDLPSILYQFENKGLHDITFNSIPSFVY